MEIKNIVKNDLVNNGKYQLWRNCRFAEYSKFLSLNYGKDFFKKYELFLGVDEEFTDFEFLMCKQIFNSQRARNSRLRAKLDFVLQNFDCLFLTLTFKDSVLSSTSKSSRRVYISRFLRDLDCSFYVANIDYGDKDKNPHSKCREHYHAIVNLDFLDLSSYTYGFIFAEKVKKSSNVSALTKYVNKLTSHSFKDSTKGRDRLIYSRKKIF